jgi:hypothetical protein
VPCGFSSLRGKLLLESRFDKLTLAVAAAMIPDLQSKPEKTQLTNYTNVQELVECCATSNLEIEYVFPFFPEPDTDSTF